MRAALVTAAVLAFGGIAEAQRPLHDPGVISHQPLPRAGGAAHVQPHVVRQAQPQASAPANGGRVFGPYSGPDGRGNPYGYTYTPLPIGYGGGFGYGGFGFGGYGLNYYNGPAYWGPAITPPVYAFPPVAYGFGPTFGYGSAYYPLGPDPLNNRLLQYEYDNDWNVLSARAAELALQNESDPVAGTSAVPVPSTPEAKLKSLRFQAQGDEAFRKQHYSRAADRYRQAVAAAKDNGGAAFRLAYTLVAIGRYGTALDYFKRGLAVEPALAITGTTPDELYGPDQQLAWTNHLGRATLWVKEDVRDAQRVLLLGILLYYDADPRAKEFLLRAWQLSGGSEAVALKLLNPPKVNAVEDKGAVIDPNGDVAAPSDNAAPDGTPIGPLGTGDATVPTPPANGNAVEPPVLPELPAPDSDLSESPANRRPVGQGPLFPLPSEQGQPADASNPPLPAPVEGTGGSR